MYVNHFDFRVLALDKHFEGHAKEKSCFNRLFWALGKAPFAYNDTSADIGWCAAHVRCREQIRHGCGRLLLTQSGNQRYALNPLGGWGFSTKGRDENNRTRCYGRCACTGVGTGQRGA